MQVARQDWLPALRQRLTCVPRVQARHTRDTTTTATPFNHQPSPVNQSPPPASQHAGLQHLGGAPRDAAPPQPHAPHDSIINRPSSHSHQSTNQSIDQSIDHPPLRPGTQAFNILAEHPETPAAFLVPRIRTAVARGLQGTYSK